MREHDDHILGRAGVLIGKAQRNILHQERCHDEEWQNPRGSAPPLPLSSESGPVGPLLSHRLLSLSTQISAAAEASPTRRSHVASEIRAYYRTKVSTCVCRGRTRGLGLRCRRACASAAEGESAKIEPEARYKHTIKTDNSSPRTQITLLTSLPGLRHCSCSYGPQKHRSCDIIFRSVRSHGCYQPNNRSIWTYREDCQGPPGLPGSTGPTGRTGSTGPIGSSGPNWLSAGCNTLDGPGHLLSRGYRVSGTAQQLIDVVVTRIEATDTQICQATTARANDAGGSSILPTAGATITAIALCWPD